MHSQVSLGKVRTPTDAWSGLGFSNSMPESAIKELVIFHYFFYFMYILKPFSSYTFIQFDE